MSETNVWKIISALPSGRFNECCRAILHGLGFYEHKAFPAPGLQAAFREVLTRESTDKMFRTEESWLIAFIRTDSGASEDLLIPAIKAAKSTGTENLLAVVLGEVEADVADNFHAEAKKANTRSLLLSDSFSAALIHDYASEFGPVDAGRRISFAKLRSRMKKQSQDATWRTQFQSLTALSAPTRIRSSSDSSGANEADLFRALVKTGSFLLLGDPGAGKTTSLRVMAEELAEKGGRTPLLLPLNQYSGNLLVDLGRVINEDGEPLPEDTVRSLLSTGALTVMLDGINEVQPLSLQSQLQDEINRLTRPNSATARSQWIVSGRRYDYQVTRRAVEHLEQNQWILQPLTHDLIFKFLADGLSGGEQEAENVYENLGAAVTEICTNPLLLNMVLVVHNTLGHIPNGRGKLYEEFINLLLKWGEDQTKRNFLAKLSEVIGPTLSEADYCQVAQDAMTNLASRMISTTIPWTEARLALIEILHLANNRAEAAKLMLGDLISRGILKEQRGSISFFHHTFQEYFQALRMRGLPVSTLIPDGGVEGAKREAVVFLAGILDSCDSLVERALKYDYMLAYDIIRSAATPINRQLQIRLGKVIWDKFIYGRKSWVGGNRPLALRFSSLAEGLGLTVEQLAREVTNPTNELQFADKLLRFYQELGDLDKQREIYERLNINKSEKIPDDLLFRAAITALAEKDYQRVVDLNTQYLEKHPNESSAFHNRAIAYRSLGKREEALTDYKRAIELDPENSVKRTSLARLLGEMDQTDQAVEQLRHAVNDPYYPQAHYDLGVLIEKQSPQEALVYFEQATRFASDPKDQERYTTKLAESQEQNSHFGEAIRSLKRLIALNPTSPQVKVWKQKIARLRLEMDEVEKRRSFREKLRGQEEVLLSALAREVLGAAGLNVEQLTSQLLLAKNDKVGLPANLTIALVDAPQITGGTIREAVQEARNRIQDSKHVLLLTSAEAFEPDARMQLLAFVSDEKVALITSIETQEAFLRGDRACYELIDRAFRRATSGGDPFKCTTVIQERLEFFGRDEQIRDLRMLIQERQPFGLYGIHKIGKSSLLLQIRQALAAYSRDTTPIAIELEPGMHNASDLYQRILEKMPDEMEVPQSTISASYLRRRLSEFQRRQQKQYPGHRILLVLDEYAYLIPDRSGKVRIKDYLDVLGMFKALYQEEEWFSILPCGRTTALSQVARWKDGENPFIGILQERFLGPLNPQENKELITTLGMKAGLTFEDQAVEQVFALTSGHPLFTRTLGSWIRYKCKDGKVTPRIVDEAANAYLDSGGDRALLLAIYEDSLDEEERRIVKELALNERPLSRSELIPDSSNVEDRRRIQDSIRNLIDTTVVEEDQGKRLSHRYELLRRAIEQRELEL